MIDVEAIIIVVLIIVTWVAKDIFGDRKYNLVTVTMTNLIKALGLDIPRNPAELSD